MVRQVNKKVDWLLLPNSWLHKVQSRSERPPHNILTVLSAAARSGVSLYSGHGCSAEGSSHLRGSSSSLPAPQGARRRRLPTAAAPGRLTKRLLCAALACTQQPAGLLAVWAGRGACRRSEVWAAASITLGLGWRLLQRCSEEERLP